SHLVPTMFHRMLALPEEVRKKYDLSSLKFIIHGAAPCPVHVKQQMLDWVGDIIYEYYGATEGVGTTITPAEWRKKPGGVGLAPEGLIIVSEETDQELPPGEIGIIWIPVPPEGGFKYFKAEEKTQKAYRNGTHYSMHDMGWVDEEGWLYLSDRRADLILAGGVNIYPAEVDAALLKHPAVSDACTIGVPNPDWGQEVMAVIELKEGVKPSEELKQDLISFCQQNLAKFKCPRKIEFMDALPRSDAGKIQRRKVRDIYIPAA
ncbi:MAG TPA: AMP-binding protein, partial [Pseudomonadales bacterium]|nr:AMP-binding protein [Pseudomonadales bacterium]